MRLFGRRGHTFIPYPMTKPYVIAARAADAKRFANEQVAAKGALNQHITFKPETDASLQPERMLNQAKGSIPIGQLAELPVKEAEKKKPKMRRWPENVLELLPYTDIVNPFKSILQRGYRLIRNDVKGFEYEGYNIGKHELQSQPPPNIRLSEKFLEREKKSGFTLLDTVLNIIFLMGVEQGRRTERKDIKPIEMLVETLDIYREKNKNQRIRIDELEVILELKTNSPNLSKEEFDIKLKTGIAARRSVRIQELKEELKLDINRSTFQFRSSPRAKFKDIVDLANSFSNGACTEAQWKELLKQRGWTFKEWKAQCKKKNITVDMV